MESIDQIPMFGKSGQMATEFLKSGSNASQTRVTKKNLTNLLEWSYNDVIMYV